jgi:hypothetical protein
MPDSSARPSTFTQGAPRQGFRAREVERREGADVFFLAVDSLRTEVYDRRRRQLAGVDALGQCQR